MLQPSRPERIILSYPFGNSGKITNTLDMAHGQLSQYGVSGPAGCCGSTQRKAAAEILFGPMVFWMPSQNEYLEDI